ncbi:MAG: oxidoreductase molybdopterin binding protein [Myxococcales bacterium]|nr:oxidoreductase molybdopterin binding protein [Myxococcales bacterium]
MRRISPWSGLFLGVVTSLLAIAVLAVANARADLPFVPFEIFEWITRILPGGVITVGIDLMVSIISALGIGSTSVAAKLAEQGMAVALFVISAAIAGAIIAVIVRGRGGSSRTRAGLIAGLAAGGVALVVGTIASAAMHSLSIGGFVWIALVLLGWGAMLGGVIVLRASVDEVPEERVERRRFLRLVTIGTTTLSAILLGIARLGGRGSTNTASNRAARGSPARERANVAVTSGPAASPSPQVLANRISPVHGTRPEITANDNFYRIDINLRPPRIDPATWHLDLGGMVDRPLRLSLDELRAMPAVSQMITLECISNRLGGDLISTSLWTGVPLAYVLQQAGMRAAAKAVHIRAADGFYESVGAEDIRDPRTLLVYAMNSVPLPEAHGFPLRIYIPNRHGMKQPKWITELRASDHDGPGYWVDRGWNKDAIPHTTSVIDTVGMSMMLGQARVLPIGGIAYAGARGISKVEVQVDLGPWTEATLVAPPLGPLTWVMWRYEWPYAPGKHTFRVRAYDGTGALQPTREEPPHPDGVAGIHSLTTSV